MYTALLWTIIGIVLASTIFAVAYITGFAFAAGGWSFHRLKRQIKTIREDQGVFVCTTHLCAVPCPKPDATCSWSCDQDDVEAVRLIQGEKNAEPRHDTP